MTQKSAVAFPRPSTNWGKIIYPVFNGEESDVSSGNHPTQSGEKQMSDAEIERVADRVFEKMQAQIGLSAIRLIIWCLTLATLSVLVWLGIVKVSHAASVVFGIHSSGHPSAS